MLHRLKVLLVAALLLAPLPALAAGTVVTTLSTTAYTDLGAAPLALQALGGNMRVVVADSLPSAVTLGAQIVAQVPPVTFNPADGSSHVYALALGSVMSAAATPVFGSNGAANDPCTYNAKSSIAISLTSAATAQLIGLSGSTAIYVCAFDVTIAPSATAADSLQFIFGTGSNCASANTPVLTGTYGNGDLTTAAPPVHVGLGSGNATLFATPAGDELCTKAVGTTVNIQGVLSYVQI
jgi:hypothetical protein